MKPAPVGTPGTCPGLLNAWQCVCGAVVTTMSSAYVVFFTKERSHGVRTPPPPGSALCKLSPMSRETINRHLSPWSNAPSARTEGPVNWTPVPSVSLRLQGPEREAVGFFIPSLGERKAGVDCTSLHSSFSILPARSVQSQGYFHPQLLAHTISLKEAGKCWPSSPHS